MLLLVQCANTNMYNMKNLFLYLFLCIAGIAIPVMLMRYVEGNIGAYLFGICFRIQTLDRQTAFGGERGEVQERQSVVEISVLVI